MGLPFLFVMPRTRISTSTSGGQELPIMNYSTFFPMVAFLLAHSSVSYARGVALLEHRRHVLANPNLMDTLFPR